MLFMCVIQKGFFLLLSGREGVFMNDITFARETSSCHFLFPFNRLCLSFLLSFIYLTANHLA